MSYRLLLGHSSLFWKAISAGNCGLKKQRHLIVCIVKALHMALNSVTYLTLLGREPYASGYSLPCCVWNELTDTENACMFKHSRLQFAPLSNHHPSTTMPALNIAISCMQETRCYVYRGSLCLIGFFASSCMRWFPALKSSGTMLSPPAAS